MKYTVVILVLLAVFGLTSNVTAEERVERNVVFGQ